MDWRNLAEVVGRSAPLLGSLLGGPVGGAVGAIVAAGLGVDATPDAVSKAIAVNPDAAVKLRMIEANERVRLHELAAQVVIAETQAATDNAADVNRTMQAEAQSEHWPTYSWRPFIGFCVGFNTAAASIIVLLVFVPMMFGNTHAAGAVASLPLVLGALAGISGVVMPILGIASWYRGKMQADPNLPTINKG